MQQRFYVDSTLVIKMPKWGGMTIEEQDRLELGERAAQDAEFQSNPYIRLLQVFVSTNVVPPPPREQENHADSLLYR